MAGFAFGTAALVVAAGDEVVARAPEAPFDERWRHRCGAPAVALAIGGDAVLVLDGRGTVAVLELATGAARRELDVGAGASSLAASEHGALAAAGPAGVVLESAGDVTPMDLRGATALALHENRLAIGTGEGAVRLVDVAAARALGASRVGGPVRSIAWSTRGLWVAAIPHALVRVSRDGTEAFQLVDARELELGPLACDPEGAFVAVRIGERKVALFDLLEGRLRANATYAAPVVGVGFGPAGTLGVGLASGDFDVIDLAAGQGREGKAVELRAKTDDIADLRERVRKGEAPSPELMRRPAAGGAPKPTAGAILAMIGFALLALLLLYLIRA
jgi:hypothetical protein